MLAENLNFNSIYVSINYNEKIINGSEAGGAGEKKLK